MLLFQLGLEWCESRPATILRHKGAALLSWDLLLELSDVATTALRFFLRVLY